MPVIALFLLAAAQMDAADGALASRDPDRNYTQSAPGASASASRQPEDPLPGLEGWSPAPAYVRLFAPGPVQEAYRAYVTPRTLEDTLNALTAEPSLLRPPGAWEPESLAPVDAFGVSGPYDKWAAARLYAGIQVRVARGPRGENGQTVESWTLMSPYPSPDFRILHPGTLLIVTHLPPV